MRTIVLSDIDHDDSGIIPYSLRLVQDLESDVRVIHVVDTRDKQGIYSAYSASQNVTPEVESYEDILLKERKKAEDYLSKHISRTVSEINLTSKVDQEVLVGQIDTIVPAETKKPDNSLLMISARPQGKVWSTSDDIFYIVAHTSDPVLLIPPNREYKKPEKALFISNLEEKEPDHLKDALDLMKPLNMQLEALTTSGNAGFESKMKEDEDWKGLLDSIKKFHSIDDDDAGKIKALAEEQNAGVIIVFEKKRNIIKRMISKSMTEKLAAITSMPLLVYYR